MHVVRKSCPCLTSLASRVLQQPLVRTSLSKNSDSCCICEGHLPVFQSVVDCRNMSTLCLASRVKEMKPNQLDDADQHAQAGKHTVKQGDLKLSGDDHQASVQNSFEEGADVAMKAAVERITQRLASKDTRVEVAEDKSSLNKQLNKDAEQGRQEVRDVRLKLMQELGRLQRDGELSSDEQHRMANAIQGVTDKYIEEINAVVKSMQHT